MQTLPSAILLDMDGTLFDSEAMYRTLWKKTAREYGIDLNDEVYKKFIGARYDQCLEFIQELGGEGFDIQGFLDLINRYEKDVLPPPPKSGVIEFLSWIENNNIPKAVVTSSGTERSELTLSTIGGKNRFDAVITGNDVQNPKPSPEPYLKACKTLGVTPQHTLAIEDSNTGALSAMSAGCPTVIVPDMLPIHNEVRNQCLLIIESLDILPGWINQQFSR
ncbi:HAD family phosphatase [Parendozoicomonas sp. Alg238-R29]|uniref:HAD family hydrolase n=1 Tax=Parendozoicomonas sp. Alg238-R29 TaxID=2993446 RepID=UPI00248F0842|nr:HAD family phosphatase [Parendozoicomonas sp. Alg238-R29]